MVRCGLEDPVRRGWTAGLVTFPSLFFLCAGPPIWGVSSSIKPESTRLALTGIGAGMTFLGVIGVVTAIVAARKRWGAPEEERAPYGPCCKYVSGSCVKFVYWGSLPAPALGLLGMLVGSILAGSSSGTPMKIVSGAVIGAGVAGIFVGGLLFVLAHAERQARKEGSYSIATSWRGIYSPNDTIVTGTYQIGNAQYQTIQRGTHRVEPASFKRVPYSGFKE